MPATIAMKPDDTVAGALVYADWLTDNGHDAAAARWRAVGLIQQALADVINRGIGVFTPTRCRSLHEVRRTVYRTVGDHVVVFCFAARTFRADLYINIGPERGRCVGYGEIRRTTWRKRPDGAIRALALKLIPEATS